MRPYCSLLEADTREPWHAVTDRLHAPFQRLCIRHIGLSCRRESLSRFSKMFSSSFLVLMVSGVFVHSIAQQSLEVFSRHQTLQDCLISKGVPTTLNSSSDWDSLTTAYNLRLQYTPIAVTIPTTPQHVSDSVTCAAASGIKVQPRSGGHSYGSYSLGGKNGSLVVDLQKFNDISLDKCSSRIPSSHLN